MQNLFAVLEAAGSGLEKLVKTTVFLLDLADFAGMNEVYARHVGDRPPRARRSASRSSRAAREWRSRPCTHESRMPAVARGRMRQCARTEVIATQEPTGFDAFAAMLAARLLYPGAIVAVGALGENVYDFYGLHADELEAVVESSGLEADAIGRLIVIDAGGGAGLGDLRAVALDPSVEKVYFEREANACVRWDRIGRRRVLRGRRAHDHTRRNPRRAGSRALAPSRRRCSRSASTTATNSLTARDRPHNRDADALPWCLRHGPRPGPWYRCAVRPEDRERTHGRTGLDEEDEPRYRVARGT